MFTAITVTSVVLLSFAPIVLFFLLTSSNYQFFKLLNVGVFAIDGIIGVVFLAQGMSVVSTSGTGRAGARVSVVRLWILIYAFVGSQVAWTLRPFVGAPPQRSRSRLPSRNRAFGQVPSPRWERVRVRAFQCFQHRTTRRRVSRSWSARNS
jgi:hypothetical protein